MVYKWISAHVKQGHVTVSRDESTGFTVLEGCDLSYLPSNIKHIQWDAFEGNSTIAYIDDGKQEDKPIEKPEDIPHYQSLLKTIAAKEEELHQQLVNEADPPPNEDDLIEWLKFERNQKLNEADILILKHVEKGETVPPKLVSYRQDLRDVPNKVTGGQLPMPTFTKSGTDIEPIYTIEFNSWPSYLA